MLIKQLSKLAMQFSNRNTSLIFNPNVAQIGSLAKILLGLVAIRPHHGL